MERTREQDEEEREINPEVEIEYEDPRIFVHELASNYYSMKDKRQELRDENRVVKWDDTEFREKGDLIIFLLVVFTVVPMLNPFASRYLTAIGRHGVFARLSPLSALLNLGFSLALVKPMGIVGVALASTIPVFIFYPYYLCYVCRYLEMSVRRYARESIAPCLLPTVLMTLAVAALRYKWGLDSYAMILAAGFSGAVIYFVLFWLLSLRSEERVYIMRRIPGLARG